MFHNVFEETVTSSILHCATDKLTKETRDCIGQFKLTILRCNTDNRFRLNHSLYRAAFHNEEIPQLAGNLDVIRNYVCDLLKHTEIYRDSAFVRAIIKDAFGRLPPCAAETKQLQKAVLDGVDDHTFFAGASEIGRAHAIMAELAFKKPSPGGINISPENKLFLGNKIIQGLTGPDSNFPVNIGILKIAFFDYECVDQTDEKQVDLLQKAVVQWAEYGKQHAATFETYERLPLLLITSDIVSPADMPVESKKNLNKLKEAEAGYLEQIFLHEGGVAHPVDFTIFFEKYFNDDPEKGPVISAENELLLHGLVISLLAKKKIDDPERLQSVAQRLASGRIPLTHTRPMIDAQGVGFLTDLFASTRTEWIPLLTRNPDFFTESELKEIAQRSELLIPASLLTSEQEVVVALMEKLVEQSLQPILQEFKEHARNSVATIKATLEAHPKIAQLPPTALSNLLTALQKTSDDWQKNRPNPEVRPLTSDELQQLLQKLEDPTVDLDNLDDNELMVIRSYEGMTDSLAPVRETIGTLSPALNEQEKFRLAIRLQLMGDHIDRPYLEKPTYTYQGDIYHSVKTDFDNAICAYKTDSDDAAFLKKVSPIVKELLKHFAFNRILWATQNGHLDYPVQQEIEELFFTHSGLDECPEDFRTEATAALDAPPAQKALRIRGVLARHGQDVPAERKAALVDALCSMDHRQIQRQALKSKMFAEVLHSTDPQLLDQLTDIVLAHKAWPELVRNHADAGNAAFADKIRDLDHAFSSHPAFALLVEKTLPYRSNRNIRELLDNPHTPCPPELRPRLEFVQRYRDYLLQQDRMAGLDQGDGDGLERDNEFLNLFVAGEDDSLQIFQSEALRFLNNQNIKRNGKLDCFKLLKPSDARWISSAVNLENTRALNLPLYLHDTIESILSAAPMFGDAMKNVLTAMLDKENLTLTEKELDLLSDCFHQVAVEVGKQITVPIETKKALMKKMQEGTLMVAYTALSHRVDMKKNQHPAPQSVSVREMHEMRNRHQENPNHHVPLTLVQEMRGDEKFQDFCSAMDEQVDQMLTTIRAVDDPNRMPEKHELFYLLGVMLTDISSVNVLGYHDKENQAFSRFRLMGAYCLSRCVVESDAMARGGLTDAQRLAITEQLGLSLFTVHCSGMISNALGPYANDALQPFVQHTARLLKAS
jgi:hypothetical protein